jgi:hypothetical protein
MYQITVIELKDIPDDEKRSIFKVPVVTRILHRDSLYEAETVAEKIIKKLNKGIGYSMTAMDLDTDNYFISKDFSISIVKIA